MNRQITLLCVGALGIMAATAGLLTRIQAHQRLSAPGVKTHPLTGSVRLAADLPAQVLDYQSQAMEVDEVTLHGLPEDTSFGQRRYTAPDGFTLDLRVVLMGTDRSSMHKPQVCLRAQGWRINEVSSVETTLPVQRPYPYDLPVVKLIATRSASADGQSQDSTGVYVYWFVADDGLSASVSGFQRMWWMATRLLRTGALQRWSYVSCLTICAPGQEGATYERMKQFIAAAVPEFQLYPRPGAVNLTATP